MLVRTVTMDKKPNKLRRTNRVRSVSKVPMSLGLRRYLDNRGTPKGTYEIVRTVTGYFDHSPAGITVGAASYETATFVIDPQNVVMQSGVISVNTNTFAIPNASELAALWDKLKIDKVDFTFSGAEVGTVNSGVASPPVFIFAFDSNDRTSSLDAIRQMDCKTWQTGYNAREFKCSIKPCYQRLVYYTSTTSSYEPTRGYIVSDTAIPHYGLKVGISQFSAASNGGRVNFVAKITFKMRELK